MACARTHIPYIIIIIVVVADRVRSVAVQKRTVRALRVRVENSLTLLSRARIRMTRRPQGKPCARHPIAVVGMIWLNSFFFLLVDGLV